MDHTRGVDDLFNSPVLRIEQPGKVLATQAMYKIFNAERALVAIAAEADARTRGQALKSVLPASPQPGAQRLVVSGADEQPRLVVDKHEGGRLTEVLRPDGEPVGTVRALRTTRHYALRDADDHRVGEVIGDLSLRRFTVTDGNGNKIAQVNKKWAGLARELLTTADRYTVEITGPAPEPLRTLIVVAAIVLDLTLYESKGIG